jgi:hypothetical protein
MPSAQAPPGDVPVRRRDVKTSFYLDPDLLRAAKVCAAADGVLLRTVLVRALTDYLARRVASGASPVGRHRESRAGRAA